MKKLYLSLIAISSFTAIDLFAKTRNIIISISKDSSDPINPGLSYKYIINITNNTDSAITKFTDKVTFSNTNDVTLLNPTDILGNQFSVSADGNIVTLTSGSIPAKASDTITIDAKVHPSATCDNMITNKAVAKTKDEQTQTAILQTPIGCPEA